ncbi:MAG: TetR/AcrR family transcriptional regulator [Ferruginibacter sp.]|nr:TetR/AcrR family transcriptional regulator [Ferruginibacter sp.]
MKQQSEIAERIKNKAHDLFMQYGIRTVSMDDIATSLGISKKTIYQYFKDKDALTEAVISTVCENDVCICERDKKLAENAVHEIFLVLDFLEEMFKGMNPSVLFDLQKYHPVSFSKFLTHKDEYLFSMIKSNLQRGVEEELYRTEIDIDVLAKYRLESIMIPFNPMFMKTMNVNIAAITKEITLHYLYGLVTPAGYKLIMKYKNRKSKKK